jgi:hypothetical protein
MSITHETPFIYTVLKMQGLWGTKIGIPVMHVIWGGLKIIGPCTSAVALY